MLRNGFLLGVVVPAVPGMAVVTVGLVLSLLRMAAGRWARLAAAGFALLLVQDIVWLSVNSWYYFGSSRFAPVHQLLTLGGTLGTVLSVAGLLLIVLAVFSARGPRRADGSPHGGSGHAQQPAYGPQPVPPPH